jgi:hypothetical protein
MVKAALIPPDGLAAVGLSEMVDNDDETASPSDYCNKLHPTRLQDIHVTTFRSWRGGPHFATESVHGFSKKATEVLDFVRTTATECRGPFTFDNGTHQTIQSRSIGDLGAVAGTDATLRVCDHTQLPARRAFFWCTGYLARGHLVAVIGVRGPAELEDTELLLRRLVPVAATTLANAG